MRVDTLLSPGQLANGYLIRREAAKAISSIETAARATSGQKTLNAARLQAFFTDCASKLATYVDAVAATVTTRVRTSATVATITFSKALDPSTTVPLSSVVFAPVRVISAISVTGSTMVITGVGLTVGDVITYTPPAGVPSAGDPVLDSLGVKTPSGVLVATFTGALA